MIINGKHKNFSDSIIHTLEQVNPVFLIFGLIILNFLSFIPHTNEEQYLLYANQHFNPNWIPGSLMATEFPGTRYLFEILIGWSADRFGFEKTVFFGRIINYLMLAFPLAAIFKQLKFSNLQMFLTLQVFIIAKQNLFGGEWIFGATEAKTFAYIFIFWGLLKFLQLKYYSAFGLIIVATYFHILIGGWFAISCLLALLIKKHSIKKTIQLGFFYGIPLLPLLYYLGKNMLLEVPEYVEEVNLNHIYVYFRNKHHVGLFYTFDYFFQKHFIGVLLSAIFFSVFLKWNRLKNFINTKPEYSSLRNLMMTMFGIGFVFVGVSLMDKLFFDLSGGYLLKSYPFRMQGMAFLIFLILTVGFIMESPKYAGQVKKLLPILAVIGIGTVGVNLSSNIQKMLNYQTDESYNEVINFIKDETPKSSLIMVLQEVDDGNMNPQNNTFAIDLMRRTRKDNFVHFKFVPSTPEKMYEWYRRLKIVEKIEKNPLFIHEINNEYSVDYALTPSSFECDFEVVFENEDYKIFKIERIGQVAKKLEINLDLKTVNN